MNCLPKISLIFVLSIMLLTISCSKDDDYPDIPVITYESFAKIGNSTGVDDKGILEFSFTDGDGDIGLFSWETQAPYDYNLFIKYFEKQNGEFKEVFLFFYNDTTQTFDTLPLDARIPILNKSGEDKLLKGKIEIELFMNNPKSNFDTIRFDAYIKDRELNVSNTISTPEIIVKKS